MRVEFVYDKSKNITNVFVWDGMQIVYSVQVEGQVEDETKIKKEVLNEVTG